MHNLKFVALLVIFCQVVGHAVCQQPDLVSFGDFMEYQVGFHKACEGVAGGTNTTQPIARAFTKCTSNIGSIKPRNNTLTSICENREKYLGCWDKLKTDTLKTCGSNKENMLPAVYRATLESLCGNDNGTKTIDSLEQSFKEITSEAQDQCPEETGIHWLINCEDSLPTFYSGDLCARHDAINKCLQKITCDNIIAGSIYRQIYADGRSHLKCNEQRP